MKMRNGPREIPGLDRRVLAAILGKQSGRIEIAFVSFCFFLLSSLRRTMKGRREDTSRVH